MASGAAGAILGYAGARLFIGGGQAVAVEKLIAALVGTSVVSGPIVAAGIAAATAIAAAVLVPAITVFVIKQNERRS